MVPGELLMAEDAGAQGPRRMPWYAEAARSALGEVDCLAYFIGAQKAGSSWLKKQLRGHSDVHFGTHKEVHYWDVIRAPHRREKVDRARRRARHRSLSLAIGVLSGRSPAEAWRRFTAAPLHAAIYEGPHAGREAHLAYARLLLHGWRGEAAVVDSTPAYGVLDAETFREMAALHPNSRFVFVMREPVARLWSGVRHRLRHDLARGRLAPEDVLDIFERTLDLPESLDFRRSDYRRTIEALEAAVPAERVLYLFYENLFTPEAMGRLATFLGIRPIRADFGRRVNAGRTLPVRLEGALLARARVRFLPVYEYVAARFGDELPTAWRAAMAEGSGR